MFYKSLLAVAQNLTMGSFLQNNQNRCLNSWKHIQALLQTEAHDVFLKWHVKQAEVEAFGE